MYHIDELVKERRNSIANTLDLYLSCPNLSICALVFCQFVTQSPNGLVDIKIM